MGASERLSGLSCIGSLDAAMCGLAVRSHLLGESVASCMGEESQSETL